MRMSGVSGSPARNCFAILRVAGKRLVGFERPAASALNCRTVRDRVVERHAKAFDNIRAGYWQSRKDRR